MTFAEKLKAARKKAGMTQEILAEKLGVSRQAITKWETERGIPDIDNMMTISTLFGISVDEFLSEEKTAIERKGYLYESTTEYDIDGRKRFDMKFGGAARLFVTGTDDEKIKVRLASDEIETLTQDFKVKIDDVKGRIDVDVKRQKRVSEATAKEFVLIDVFLPNKYLSHVELGVNCDELYISNLQCEDIEFDGRANSLTVDSVIGTVEVNCNLDMMITCTRMTGAIEINQISATSQITIPNDFVFQSVLKGIGNTISYEEAGEAVEDFSTEDADNVIELNGMRSELVIRRTKEAF